MPNRALVMSGGGSRGAFELGAVDYLVNERDLDFQVIAGVSTGSLNAVMLAHGEDRERLKEQLRRLKEIWFSIRSYRDVYKKRFLGELLILINKPSLYDSKPIWKKIQTHVDPDRLSRSGRQLRIGAVSLESGDYRSIDQNDPEIREWTLASSSMPLLFPPVAVAGEHAVDGGVRDVTPLEDAFRALKLLGGGLSAEPDEMYIVLASPLGIAPVRTRWKKGLPVAERSVGILINEIFREDIAYALLVNRSVRAFQDVRQKLVGLMGEEETERFLEDVSIPFRPPKYRYVRIYGVIPEVEFSEALEFNPKKIRAAYEAGWEAARTPLSEEQIREILARLTGRRAGFGAT